MIHNAVRKQLNVRVFNINDKASSYRFNWHGHMFTVDNNRPKKQVKYYNMYPPEDQTWEDRVVDGKKTSENLRHQFGLF